VPELTLTPPRLTFGRQTVGSQSESQTITITNSGTAPVTIVGANLIALDSQNFRLGRHNCDDIELLAAATCEISVVFAPQTTGSLQAKLQVQSNATNSPHDVALVGAAQAAVGIPTPPPRNPPTHTPVDPPTDPLPPAALIGIVPQDPLDFEYTANSPKSVVISSRGDGALTLGNIAITGPFVEDFAITSDSCSGQTLDSPEQTCEVQVQFTPVSSDARVNAQLAIPSNASTSLVMVDLFGSILQ
jgi:hypothetical protein